MKAIFLAFTADPTHRLTAALSSHPRERAGAKGRLVEIADDAPSRGLTVLEGADLAAIAEAHGIESHTPAEPVPPTVPLWRIKAVLELLGRTADVQAAIDAMSEPARTVAAAAWQHGNEAARGSQTIAAIGAALGLSSGQLDDIFRQAAALSV